MKSNIGVLSAWLIVAGACATQAVAQTQSGPPPVPAQETPRINGTPWNRIELGRRYTTNSTGEIVVQAEAFQWEEFDNDGRRLLRESGALYGLSMGSEAYKAAGGHLGLRNRFTLFGGSVNYDGQTQSGTPAKSTTDYVGLDVDLGLVGRFSPVSPLNVKLFADLGMKYWLRDIQSSGDGLGYAEYWTVVDGRLGGGADYALPGEVTVFAEGGCHAPIYAQNEADWTDFGYDLTTLYPEQTVTPFATAGIRWRFLTASVFYDSLRFDRSESEVTSGPAGSIAIRQPKSTSDNYGGRIGVCGRF